MTIQEKKLLLKKYGQLDEKIEQLRREREECKQCDKFHTLQFEEKVKGGKDKGSVVEVTAEKRAQDWEALIKKELMNLYTLRTQIEYAINKLADFTEQKLLRLLYLGEIDEFGDRNRYTFSEISKILNYSERQIYRIYKKALINLPEIICVSECQ